MALQDRVMEETKDKKNAVEAYVYEMRNKLRTKYQDFATAREKDEFSVKLQEVEDWLYEDGEDETKGVYIAKLEEMKKQGDPIEERFKDWTEREPAIEQLFHCINSFREAALSNDPRLDHIGMAEKQKVINECGEAEAWLREKMQQQYSLPKYATPVLQAADVKKKAETLDRSCRPVMTKPGPPPAKPQTPPPTEAQTPEHEATEQQHPVGDGTDGNGHAPASSSEPMEMDKSEGVKDPVV